LRSEAIGVLTIREASTRLGISTAEMEHMVGCGKVRCVVPGWSRFVVAADLALDRG